ncbi:MAG: hypothetical protein A2275_10960 [Bacteroidetes bacterium RIFOXYA12_FULL_35_11]|nr:MAG: hypothetical protein A2275_10960 [Bacteroidetes bacterium RIFOXYA12_FULL_35_11]OFY97963.1 MAG: hypothetical protein A2491_10030 [Bacteroidetes bacterium RIFOXYC12_FULL_35_7]
MKYYYLMRIKAKKVTLVTVLFFICVSLFAQNNVFREDNQLTFKESESYKTINFRVDFLNSDQQIKSFLQLFKGNNNFFNVEYNAVSKICNIESKLSIDKTNVVYLTGNAGYKISEYSEKVNLMIQMPVVSADERAKIEADREEQNRILNAWPADFPQFIDTGNSEYDNKDYKKRKDEWIKNNPEKYKAISSSSKKNETDEEKQERIKRENFNK